MLEGNIVDSGIALFSSKEAIDTQFNRIERRNKQVLKGVSTLHAIYSSPRDIFSVVAPSILHAAYMGRTA
jgi:hypothetical protein